MNFKPGDIVVYKHPGVFIKVIFIVLGVEMMNVRIMSISHPQKRFIGKKYTFYYVEEDFLHLKDLDLSEK